MRLLVGLTLCAGLTFAQFGGWGRGGGHREQTIRASIQGGGGDSGKCTAEVVVDGTAEVSITGDTGRIRTLAGQPSTWRRLVCTGPLPSNPTDFRFSGVDGRGSQTLVRDPRSSHGAAIVRIDDPKAGSEGYTFDIEWRGGNGYGNNPGSWNDHGRTNPSDRGYSGQPGNWPNDGGTYDRGRGGWQNDRGIGNNNAASGWNNSWGNEIAFRGRGQGEFVRNGSQPSMVRGVDVNVNRDSGRVMVNMDTQNGRDSLAFTGRIQRVEGNTIYADVRAGAGASGVMRIRVANGQRVDSIDMDGSGAGGQFRLNWRE